MNWQTAPSLQEAESTIDVGRVRVHHTRVNRNKCCELAGSDWQPGHAVGTHTVTERCVPVCGARKLLHEAVCESARV